MSDICVCTHSADLHSTPVSYDVEGGEDIDTGVVWHRCLAPGCECEAFWKDPPFEELCAPV